MGETPGGRTPRRLVAESWARARAGRLAPDRAEPGPPLEVDRLEDVRGSHPLASALPIIRSLLVRDADEDSGVVVAVGDAAGRLLWVEGDPALVRRAEAMRFVPGADWSEPRVGTSAPGTALALDRPVQIAGEEHFALQVQQWSCTAVPVHDLRTHETIGVLDITGGPDVAAPRSLPLLEATAAAVERELLLQRLARGGRRRAPRPEPARAPRLAVLGQDHGRLAAGGRTVELSLRHAELLTLLAWHRTGLSAEHLAELVHGRADAVATVRPEMVRLRHVLAGVAPSLVPVARPYRLPVPIDLDVRQLLALLDRGAHRAALDAWRGEVLPGSVAPGIEAIRAEASGRLREALLESASPALLLDYAERVAPGDPEPLFTALRLLPARSPKRAGVVARLDALG
ncbi:sigma-54-dependent transcriptional regulator family protein [Amnibacterium setariae]|uniref:GAF domain-containing protein n=1 Tax=Amnibacterium setariae TaxID=2306585 RepID=A0A3A1U4A3_9MICO|nr:GAF domain-containing protein [Amnibacterium setariae]RIX31193.1 GAF domain-containing protein [Amnibacterium setariae]